MIVHRDIIVTIIKDKIIENLVRWYGYMQRWPLKALVRRVDCMVFSFVKRDGGRLINLLLCFRIRMCTHCVKLILLSTKQIDS